MLARSLLLCRFSTTSAAGAAATSDAFAGLSPFINNYSADRAARGFGAKVNFDRDIAPALTSYKNLGFSKEDLSAIFKKKISALCVNNGNNDRIQQDIQQLSSLLQQDFELSPTEIRTLISKNPAVLSLTSVQLKERITLLSQLIGLPITEAVKVAVNYPRVLSSDMERKIEKVKRIFKIWGAFSEERIVALIAAHPYLADFNPDHVHDNIRLLTLHGFTSDNIHQLVQSNPDVLLEKTAQIENSFYLPKSLGLTQKEVIEVFLANPKLITICPVSMIPIKIKMLKNFRVVNDDNLKQIWQNNPQLFLSSIGSLDLKNKYLSQRAFSLGKPKNLAAYYSLVYSDVIRPRCELAIRLGKQINLDVDLLLSEQEFLAKHSITEQQLAKVKTERTVTDEIDTKIRFYFAQTQ